ncbi:hypothetical protein GVN24_32410 [Rhizobium sp. CRIBSB]|nr:hypothetical protein [Rhizobium sp. CRIBSB]
MSSVGIAMAVQLALAVGGLPGQDNSGQSTTQPPAPETAIEGIVVDGRRLRELSRDFVSAIAAPPRARGLALWRGPVCVGVANLNIELSQYLVDRVSTVAADLNLETGEPGCAPNIVIAFAADAAAMADAVVTREPRNFRLSVANMHGDAVDLRSFRSGDHPVRWWTVSVPVNSETGDRAIRLPGDVSPSGEPTAPTISVFAASRINTQIRDDLARIIVIVDADDAARVSLPQLADYLAMVTMAQIDNDADTDGFDTVLNVFDNPASADGLTEWDWSYLRALYASRSERTTSGAQAGQLARIIERDRRAAAQAEE